MKITVKKKHLKIILEMLKSNPRRAKSYRRRFAYRLNALSKLGVNVDENGYQDIKRLIGWRA